MVQKKSHKTHAFYCYQVRMTSVKSICIQFTKFIVVIEDSIKIITCICNYLFSKQFHNTYVITSLRAVEFSVFMTSHCICIWFVVIIISMVMVPTVQNGSDTFIFKGGKAKGFQQLLKESQPLGKS